MGALTILVSVLLSGVAGGNIAGLLFKKVSLGIMGNTLAGLVGGGLGAQVLQAYPLAALPGVIGYVLFGGIGGVALMIVLGQIRRSVNR